MILKMVSIVFLKECNYYFLLVDVTLSDPSFKELEVPLMSHWMFLIFFLPKKHDNFQMRYFRQVLRAPAAGIKKEIKSSARVEI